MDAINHLSLLFPIKELAKVLNQLKLRSATSTFVADYFAQVSMSKRRAYAIELKSPVGI